MSDFDIVFDYIVKQGVYLKRGKCSGATKTDCWKFKYYVIDNIKYDLDIMATMYIPQQEDFKGEKTIDIKGIRSIIAKIYYTATEDIQTWIEGEEGEEGEEYIPYCFNDILEEAKKIKWTKAIRN